MEILDAFANAVRECGFIAKRVKNAGYPHYYRIYHRRLNAGSTSLGKIWLNEGVLGFDAYSEGFIGYTLADPLSSDKFFARLATVARRHGLRISTTRC